MLAWLAARDGPLTAAAARMHRARGSGGMGFSADERAMLDDAGDALRAAGVSLNAAPPIDNLLSAITALRADARFASAPPARSAEVGGAWAINLALASLPTPAPQPGIVTRAALRVDLSLDREELLRSWGAAAALVYERVRHVADRLRDVSPIVDSFSINARIKEVIGAMAALEMVRRPQVKRGWALSEAGTTLIMRQLTDAGIARSDGRGELTWAYAPACRALVADHAPEDNAAIVEFDEAMAFAKRVLWPHPRSPRSGCSTDARRCGRS